MYKMPSHFVSDKFATANLQMLKITLDTNILMHSDEIVEKVEDHHLKIKSAILKAIEICTIVEPKTKLSVVAEDPDDNKILVCALEAKVDYVISYDEHLLKLKEFEGIKLILPKEFLKKYPL